jgi:hypothetical protein
MAQGTGTCRHATLIQQRFQFLQRAVDAHPRRVLVTVQRLTDCAEILLLKEAEQDRRAIRFLQFVDGCVEQWRDP